MFELPEKYWIYALGFFSQGLFAIRLLVQWFLSEKEGRVVSPVIFWQISVVACYLFIVYGIVQNDWVIVIGQGIAYIIYIRNLQIEGAWNSMPGSFRIAAIILPVVTLVWLVMRNAEQGVAFNFTTFLHPVVFLGALGQMLLNFRFVYQWWYAEKMKTSILPAGFWLLTVVGSAMVVIYAVIENPGRPVGIDPVLLFAQGLGLVAALRNLQLHYKAKSAE